VCKISEVVGLILMVVDCKVPCIERGGLIEITHDKAPHPVSMLKLRVSNP